MFRILLLVVRAFLPNRVEAKRVLTTRDIASLVAFAEIPRVKELLRDVDEDFLHQFHLARLELARYHENRRRNATVSRPTLEGSPSTWGWKVDLASQMAAIQRGLEDAISSTLFDPKEPPNGPQPLTGHMMKDMFYDYHDKHPQLRNLPTSRRSTDELIWTIESSSEGSNWKITLSTSLAASLANSLESGASESQSGQNVGPVDQLTTYPDQPRKSPGEKGPSTPLIEEKPKSEPWYISDPNAQSRPPSIYAAAPETASISLSTSSLSSLKMERRPSLPPRSVRPSVRGPDYSGSRIPRVASKISLHSVASNPNSEKPTPNHSRAPSPALRNVRKPAPPPLSTPTPLFRSSSSNGTSNGRTLPPQPASQLRNKSRPPLRTRPRAGDSALSQSTFSRSSSTPAPPLSADADLRPRSQRPPVDRAYVPPPPPPQRTLRSRPASQMSLRPMRTPTPTPSSAGPVEASSTDSSPSSPTRPLPEPMRSSTNLAASIRGRGRSNTTTGATSTWTSTVKQRGTMGPPPSVFNAVAAPGAPRAA